jgi:hypothetical protein
MVFDVADFESRNTNKQLELYGGYRELNAAWDIGDGGHPNNAGSDMLAYELISKLASIAQYSNVFESSHVLTGLTQSGTLSIESTGSVSGNHSLSGLTQSGNITNTAPPRALSGTNVLGGLIQSGVLIIGNYNSLSGANVLTGLSQSGDMSVLNITYTVIGSHLIGGIIQSGTMSNFVPGTHIITGSHILTGIIQDSYIFEIPIPEETELCNVYTYVFKPDGTTYSNLTSRADIELYDADNNNFYAGYVDGVYNSSTGLVYWDIVQGAHARVSITEIGLYRNILVPSDITKKLDDLE